mmetsp:Transcript_23496/g.65361  ORF Transcript_23496/g.65361 Transcript_23496/m.65361 type:complete len:869 (-) Transcript_23496:36-2642(-)
MSHHGSSLSSSTQNAPEQIEPRRLELTLNPENGSLLTAPLTQVLLATTDSLYQDLYNMAHGELDVSTVAQTDADATQEEETAPMQQTRRERMSNLSFAQRRHELAWRLAQHGRALQHVAGLTAADSSSDFARQVQISSTALQHARTAWVQADEAQDAMYFFHAQLFPARAAPHDIYGSCDVHLTGKWYDLPSDLRLASSRYETARESEYSRGEVNERWQMAVRDKLLSGEVAWMKKRGIQRMFDLSLKGGVLKLTHGSHRRIGTNSEASYPIQALLTIVSSAEVNEWTLLSLDVRVQAKTGEFNHQLETSNRQRFDLHRLAALAMSREEARVRKLNQENELEKDESDESEEDEVSHPLNALFQLAHTFSLSWQLELLSAQAQALRRGAWSAGEGNQINVTPVRFLDDNNSNLLGAVSISFWKVDDSYGPPSMGDLLTDDRPRHMATGSPNLRNFIDSTNQLVLSIRAEKTVGIKVALSGGTTIQSDTDAAPHIKEIVQKLLGASSDPFALSASDALLAATQLCAERKCEASVRALQPTSGDRILPEWISLSSERGNISVAARLSYHGVPDSSANGAMTVLFRLACDARTGSFAPTFPRTMKLLRYLACNDIQSSESVALRIANAPSNRRRAAANRSTGRLVKEAFDGLVRSMNVLGQRVGVGRSWDDKDEQSASIRDRSIGLACRDVSVSISKCCGFAGLFGIGPAAFAALGINAVPDMAGETIDSMPGFSFFPTPPLSIVVDQQLIETSRTSSDGVSIKKSYLQQKLMGITFATSDQQLTLYPLDITVTIDNPSSVPERKSCAVKLFGVAATAGEDRTEGSEPPQKKIKTDANGGCHELNSLNTKQNLMDLVSRFSSILNSTVVNSS